MADGFFFVFFDLFVPFPLRLGTELWRRPSALILWGLPDIFQIDSRDFFFVCIYL